LRELKEQKGLFPITIEAPAKLNLFLEVIGKLPTGKHELLSLMARLELSDTITLCVADEDNSLERKMAVKYGKTLCFTGGNDSEGKNNLELRDTLSYEFQIPGSPDSKFLGKDNLVLRAISSFRKETGVPEFGIKAHIIKRIPISGGLGGGSSDGASVLKALNKIYMSPLSQEKLRIIAFELGADLPFFMEDESLLLARGVGEKLTPWTGKTPFPMVLLINPKETLSTSDVFKEYELTKGLLSNNLTKEFDSSMGKYGSFEDKLTNTSFSPEGANSKDTKVTSYPPFGYNALSPIAINMCPSLKELHLALEKVKEGSYGMSGSGSSFWALYKTEEKILKAKEFLKKWWTKITKIV
jgi:4-diphosphocytidyl-2-C-methyl-D-erythritol kinase